MTTRIKRKQTNYHKIIGRIDNEYFFLDYIFGEGKEFKGATGSIMVPVTKAQAQERRDDWDNDNEFWKQAVEDDQTELSADDWHNMVRNTEDDDLYFDLSYFDEYGEPLKDWLNLEIEDEDDQIELCECVGGGRCFKPDMKWDKIYDPELWKKIVKIES